MNIRKGLSICITTLSLLVSNNVFANKPDTTVQYNKAGAYCLKSLHLNYSPGKDELFCSRNPGANYIYVDRKGNPFCKDPYTLVYEPKPSVLYKKTPKCVPPKVLKNNKTKLN